MTVSETTSRKNGTTEPAKKVRGPRVAKPLSTLDAARLLMVLRARVGADWPKVEAVVKALDTVAM